MRRVPRLGSGQRGLLPAFAPGQAAQQEGKEKSRLSPTLGTSSEISFGKKISSKL